MISSINVALVSSSSDLAVARNWRRSHDLKRGVTIIDHAVGCFVGDRFALGLSSHLRELTFSLCSLFAVLDLPILVERDL